MISLDADVAAEALFETLDLTMSSAINLFMRQCLHERQLPFQPSLNVPNKETLQTIEESNEMLRTGHFKRYTVSEAFEELEK